MGKFIGIIAAALDEREGAFVQTTELLDFPDEVWVYYCRPHMGAPKPGWTDLAAGTLRVSLEPEPFRHDQLEWQPSVSPDSDRGSFEYMADVMGVEPGNNIFHLALPPGFLPIVDSWDVPPLYGHADGDRFVLGWSINWNNETQDNQWPTFRFEPVAPDAFAARANDIGRHIERAARTRRRQLMTPWAPESEIDQGVLLDRLVGRFDLEGIRTLVFELGGDYDELAGETKSGKVRELILYMERQDQLPRLLSHLRSRYNFVFRH
jgi:hypothetical protein